MGMGGGELGDLCIVLWLYFWFCGVEFWVARLG